MHKNPFPNGGFVLHKITHLSKGKISAWYRPDGSLYDCHLIDSMNRTQGIVINGPLWKKLAKLGPIWKDKGPVWKS